MSDLQNENVLFSSFRKLIAELMIVKCSKSLLIDILEVQSDDVFHIIWI